MTTVLLISTYELGHQPVHLAVPAGELRANGHDVRCVDLAVDDWDPAVLEGVDRVAISAHMHTAMRLALPLLAQIDVPVATYGLYGETFPGEYLAPLLAWAGGGELRGAAPARDLLPSLDRYARLAPDMRLVGAVEAGRGCASRCRHCPVPAVYDGRTRIVAVDEVVADVASLVALGATHITFADPDFLSGPHHARRVVDAVHSTFPTITFDITTKVELALRHADLWRSFAAAGCLFVTSAIECVDDDVLRILDKGHTTADAAAEVALLRSHGIDVRPSLLPFTPWTSRSSLLDLARFVDDHDLAGSVDPVHWSIRLLLPPGSLLLEVPQIQPYLTTFDASLLGTQWVSADPAMDALQRDIAECVEEGGDFADVCALLGAPAPRPWTPAEARPHLTESWFCCAEPTAAQSSRISRSTASNRLN